MSAEGDITVDAGMVTVGDERRAVEPRARVEPHAGRELVAGEPFAALAHEHERDAERDRGERVTPVVDEVREQRDGVRGDEDERLQL